jgi:hypothetical protein
MGDIARPPCDKATILAERYLDENPAQRAHWKRYFKLRQDPLITVKRYSKLLREQGTKGFFALKNRRSALVLTQAVLGQAQRLLDAGRAWRRCYERVSEGFRLFCFTPFGRVREKRLSAKGGKTL